MNSKSHPSSLRAAALAYDPLNDQAPKLVAKGSGAIASRIIEKANEHNIPIHQDAGLVSFLMKLDFDEHIPAELYAAVAQVLALLWSLEQQKNPNSSIPPSLPQEPIRNNP